MIWALIIGWFVVTAAIGLLVGRAIRRADARHERETLEARRARPAVPMHRDPRSGPPSPPKAP
jgi:hypothetical protein